MPLIRSLWAALLDLAAERDCGGCGRPQPSGEPLCEACARLLAEGGPWRALAAVPGTPRTHTVARYEDPVRTMLIAYKERGRSDLRRALGRALARAVAQTLDAVDGQVFARRADALAARDRDRALPPPAARERDQVLPPSSVHDRDRVLPLLAARDRDWVLLPPPAARERDQVLPPPSARDRDRALPPPSARERDRPQPPLPLALVPMPSRRKVVRERGADTTAHLARTAARALREVGVPVRVVPALCHARAVEDQAGLSREQRQANLAGALRVRRAGVVAASTTILVDDISTSGASLAEAARALRAAGVPVLGAATIAAARVRS